VLSPKIPSGAATPQISDNRASEQGHHGADGPSVTALVVGTDDWAIEQGAEAIEESGMAVLRCHEPGAPAFPCNAFRPDGECPLDRGFDVVVSMRGTPLTTLAPSEFGVVCASRQGAPLIVAGLTSHSPLAPWAVEIVDAADELPEAVVRAASRRPLPVDQI
jgi:hypothetical protein